MIVGDGVIVGVFVLVGITVKVGVKVGLLVGGGGVGDDAQACKRKNKNSEIQTFLRIPTMILQSRIRNNRSRHVGNQHHEFLDNLGIKMFSRFGLDVFKGFVL